MDLDEEVAPLFLALADPTRRAVVRLLGTGPRRAGELADAARAVAQRCEPGVGGRLLEVYDGDALELGRITVWEPGARLAWRSSTDDVEIDVRFDRSAGGTTVRVDARIPAGGEDRGGT